MLSYEYKGLEYELRTHRQYELLAFWGATPVRQSPSLLHALLLIGLVYTELHSVYSRISPLGGNQRFGGWLGESLHDS